MSELRLRRIFGSDGRSVILAMDHAGFMGPMPGLEHPQALLERASDAGIDAVLTTWGIGRAFGSSLGRMGLILRMDGGASMRSPKPGGLRRLFSVEDALRVGADAVACMGMIGFDEEPDSLRNLTELAADSARWQVPLMAEMLVKPAAETAVTPEDVGFAIRIGVELGADWIKTSYAPPKDRYRSVIEACYRPVVVLGGTKSEDDAAFLASIHEALEVGARGVAVGRNVWQHPDPAGMCRALVALVHGGASVTQAMKEVTG